MRGSFDLTGKTALVTGAGRGIGRSIALAFAEKGASLALLGTSRPRLELLQAEMEKIGGTARVFDFDLSMVEGIPSLVERIASEFALPSILVNNAGIADACSWQEVTPGIWDRTFAVNVKAPFFLTQSIAQQWIKAEIPGVVINTTSEVVDRVERLPLGAYGPSKAALHNITKTFARELGKYGIRVNSLAPCFVHTDINEPFYRDHADWYQAKLAEVPLGREGHPEDLVGAALLLASEAGAYISGTTILVDGGLTA